MKKKSLTWQLPFLILLIVGTVLIIRQQHNMPYQNNKGFIFGTTYNITYQHDKDLGKEILVALNQVDASLSPFNEKSIITKINNNVSVKPDKMFVEVFELAKQISTETHGAFDITVAPMVNAWGFGFKSGTSPTKEVIDSIKEIVGFDKISLKNNKIVKQDPRTTLDCSAIAKGYGCDIVARLFRNKDIKNFMIEIGGEVVTSGISEKRIPWKIGVTKPTDDSLSTNQELQTILNITDMAMATSGNYRNFYYKNGKKYAHTIDPKTGYPVQHNILSATVLASDCATADAYATSFMVLGLDGAMKILEQHPELMAYFIYSDQKGHNAVWYSPSMKGKVIE
ncbi:MAG: FAD:protein FMN transferase [Prevotella sp.]|nr:FAD:protein FMN transferase [Prevotella sp.]